MKNNFQLPWRPQETQRDRGAVTMDCVQVERNGKMLDWIGVPPKGPKPKSRFSGKLNSLKRWEFGYEF